MWWTTWSIKLVNVGFLKHSTVSVFFTGPFFTTIWGILFICAKHQTSKSKYFCLPLEYFLSFSGRDPGTYWCERSYKTTFLSAFAYFQGATFVLGSFLRHNFPQLFWWKEKLLKEGLVPTWQSAGPRHWGMGSWAVKDLLFWTRSLGALRVDQGMEGMEGE